MESIDRPSQVGLPVARTYLDHAATGWPKPPGVVEALVAFQNECGSAVGRGATQNARKASKVLENTKRELRELLHASTNEDLALLCNGTQAINGALMGLLRSGDHVVTTAAEHNSVLRPLAALANQRSVEWTVVPVNSEGRVAVDDMRAAIRPQTRMIAVTHASNVTGAIQPIESIASMAREFRIPFFVDAAQSLGYQAIDVRKMGIDILAAPGHKGLGGMLGTGFLYLHPSLHERFQPPWIGGTGSMSDQLDGPFPWALALESGNPNGPAIASLEAGIEYLRREGLATRIETLKEMTTRLLEILRKHSEFQIIGPPDPQSRVPVVSVVGRSMSPQEWAALLDSSFGIETRAGLHCAGRIHHYLKTQPQGTLRFSLGHTSQWSDLDRLDFALQEILGNV